jgi:hypothetical protein
MYGGGSFEFFFNSGLGFSYFFSVRSFSSKSLSTKRKASAETKISHKQSSSEIIINNRLPANTMVAGLGRRSYTKNMVSVQPNMLMMAKNCAQRMR